MNQHIKEILVKQCEIIGIYFADVDFDDELWFLSHQWTKEQESHFIDWLTNYFYQNKEARNSLMAYPMKRKKHCEKVAREWAFKYGWKYKE